MRVYTLPEIKLITAQKFKDNEMNSLFPFLSSQIYLSKDTNYINELILLKAECYQRIGDLRSAELSLDKFDKTKVSQKDASDIEILNLKLAFQNGSWEKALNSSEIVINQHRIQKNNVLWRTSLLYAISGDKKESEKYSRLHNEIIQMGGFQEANNILYTKTIPHLLHNHGCTSLLKTISPIETAQEIYLNSNINFDTYNRVGSRIKSYCQSTILEAFIQWDFGNKYDAYVLSILTGLCMAHSMINLKAEGIGEIVNLFRDKYKCLISLIELARNESSEIFYLEVAKYYNYSLIRSAYSDAIHRFEEIIMHDEEKIKISLKNTDDKKSILTDKIPPGRNIKNFH